MTSSTSAPTASPERREPRRLGGLDGLRAIAVGLVLAYHLFPDALPGGFLGVDVFFAISGFLIATLLLDERRRRGYLSLGSFWRRRARRLLPALALVLLVSSSAALLLGDRDLLVNIGPQLAGAAAFVANWVYIALGADYFARDNPELFRNTWSLAIEEQFYLLLPLVLLLALRMSSRATRALVFALLGLASAWWMAALFEQGAAATRVYFGTDTHTFGLLLGVALACAVPPWGAVRRRALAVWQQLGLLVVGAAALAALGWLALTLREGSPESFTGGFQLAAVIVLLVVWAGTREGSWFGLALDLQPLRWIGERSYGIYLWHWPLLLIVGSAAARSELAAGVAPVVVPVIVLALTLAVAELSHRFVEQPIRRLGLRASLGLLLRPVRLHGRRLAVGFAMLALLAVTLPATGMAVAAAPTQSSSTDAIARGQAALEAQTAAQRANREHGQHGQHGLHGQHDAPDRTATGDLRGDGAPGSGVFDTDWAVTPDYQAPPPVPIEGWEIFAIGDSVMLASFPELAAAFPDIWVDASVSRGLAVGVGIVEDLARSDSLRPVIVVGLGTNGPIQDDDLKKLLRIADGRRIVLVNAYADRWWTAEVNRQLRAFAEAHRGVALADWAGIIVTVPGGLAGDDVHPNPSGGAAYARAVQLALDSLIGPDELPPRRPAP